MPFEDISHAAVQHAKLCLLDGVGVCLHGAALPWTGMVQDMVIAEGGNAQASIWGRAEKISWSQALLANSTGGHPFEMGDIHMDSVLHPNSITVPTALGYVEVAGGLAGRNVLTAMIAGYEVGTWVGSAATTQLFLNGFHPQGTTGTFPAGATAGRLLGLDAGAMVKRLRCGRAAQSGVYAALLAARDFMGISDVLEAPYGGFLSALSREPDMACLTAGLGRNWEVLRVGFKMYPSVTSIHSALDALQRLMREHRLTSDDISSIEVGVGHMTYVHTAWPYQPAGITGAQMNLFLELAVMACGLDVGVADYVEDNLADPALLDFMRRITVFDDPAISARGRAARHACRMAPTTQAGTTLHREILERRGSPENSSQQDGDQGKIPRQCAPLPVRRGNRRRDGAGRAVRQHRRPDQFAGASHLVADPPKPVMVLDRLHESWL